MHWQKNICTKMGATTGIQQTHGFPESLATVYLIDF